MPENNNTKNTSGGGGGGGGGTATTQRCGVWELTIFVVAIVTGTACSICSKTMMQLKGTGITGEEEIFEKPIFQTFGMFVGMLFGLVMHWFVLLFKIPFPGYDHPNSAKTTTTTTTTRATTTAKTAQGQQQTLPTTALTVSRLPPQEQDPLIPPKNIKTVKMATPETDQETLLKSNNNNTNNHTPMWMYWFLIIPSIFDLGATALCMMGLRYLDVSIYQLLRGSGIIFVALMKQHVLGDRLYIFQWLGVFWNVIAVVLVGATAILNSEVTSGNNEYDDDNNNNDNDNDNSNNDPNSTAMGLNNNPGDALLGVTLVMLGAFVQALQFVFEEKVMTLDEAAVPPLLLIGMEGFWGTVLCLLLVYPLAYYLPGEDHGSYEDPINTYHMFMNTPVIHYAFVIYFLAIFGYNLFAVLVTFSLNSVWHAILDNFRPITVWLTDLTIYYVITAGEYGETWTRFSFLQLTGMFVLLYGTSIYNAPHPGSLKLKGDWWALWLNLSSEYHTVEQELHEAEMHAEWERKRAEFKLRRPSSLSERSPHISIHTQALHGLGTPKM